MDFKYLQRVILLDMYSTNGTRIDKGAYYVKKARRSKEPSAVVKIDGVVLTYPLSKILNVEEYYKKQRETNQPDPTYVAGIGKKKKENKE